MIEENQGKDNSESAATLEETVQPLEHPRKSGLHGFEVFLLAISVVAVPLIIASVLSLQPEPPLPIEGKVISKAFIPAHMETTYIASDSAVIPIAIDVPDEYCLYLDTDSNQKKDKKECIPQNEYDLIKVGDFYKEAEAR